MRCGIFLVKKEKLWVLKAVDRGTGRTVDGVLGHCDTVTFRRLSNKMKHLKGCVLYGQMGGFRKGFTAGKTCDGQGA